VYSLSTSSQQLSSGFIFGGVDLWWVVLYQFETQLQMTVCSSVVANEHTVYEKGTEDGSVTRVRGSQADVRPVRFM